MLSGVTFFKKIAEAETVPGQVQIDPVADNEIHWYVEGILNVVGKTGVRVVEEGQKSGPVGVGSRPDLSTGAQKSTRFAIE